MKLTTEVTLLFVSAVNSDIFVVVFLSHLWIIKLTESKNIFCISGRVACTIKLNTKESFMGNPTKVYVVNGLQSDNKKPIT